MSSEQKDLCTVCQRNPGTITFPTKPLKGGVQPGQLVRLCPVCQELTEANTDLLKSIRFLNDAVKRLEKIRGPGTPPIEAMNFALDLTEKAKQLAAGVLVVNGFVRDVNRMKPEKPQDFLELIWGPKGKP